MTRRSRKYKKYFACGHRGFGKFCHFCADQEQKKQQHYQKAQRIQEAKYQMRQLWQQTFAKDRISLKHLPKKIVLKARSILSSLEKGVEFWQLSGKRFVADRSFISIPVTYRYRLVGRLYRDRFYPHEVLPHESYNRIAHHGRMRVAGDRPKA